MPNQRLLIVEDDIDIAQTFKLYFMSLGYNVEVANRGSDALDKTRYWMPSLIILDIMLPDIDGYEVCRALRTSTRTSHIPVIFLTQKDERSDKIQGLELGADDYITKPLDIEELKERVKKVLTRSERELLTDACTGLPKGRLIDEQLRRIIRERDWALLYAQINNFIPFKDVYGFMAGDDVLRFTAMLIGEVVDELGTSRDFVGCFNGVNFVLITWHDKPVEIKNSLKERFDNEVVTHYNFMDRQQGFVQVPNPDGTILNVPFMNLRVGIVTPHEHNFADVREITELAIEARRQDSESGDLIEERLRHIIDEKNWAYLYIQIKYFEAYQEIYEPSDINDVILITAKVIKDAIGELHMINSFFSHPEKDKFVVVVPDKIVEHFCEIIKRNFNNNIISKYYYIHRKQGFIRTNDSEKHPFMKLGVGVASTSSHCFSNPREIVEYAKNACLMDDQ